MLDLGEEDEGFGKRGTEFNCPSEKTFINPYRQAAQQDGIFREKLQFH